MTRFLGGGALIVVLADAEGLPLDFQWEGQMHPVDQIIDQWRVDVDWWRWRVWREYFKMTTHTGWLVVVYHDLVGEQWYLQRVYD